MVESGDLNPLKLIGLSKFDLGLGAVGNALMLIVVIVLIFILIGVIIFFYHRRKQYKYLIPLYAKIGNVPTRVAMYRAKKVPMGRAGDELWYVAGSKKFIPPPTIQSAPREFLHWQREDGEWINFAIGDLDLDAKKSGVKYVHQDMRMQRLATDRLLEQRLMQKSFWEKYGLMLTYLIFFLVITISMVVIFYQWSGIIEKTDSLLGKINGLMDKVDTLNGGQSAELVPALSLPITLLGVKRKWHS